MTLPGGTGTPAADFAQPYAEARAACQAVNNFQAELSVSGRAGGQRLRGRVLSGIAPGALRLEGVAPFGAPVFILVADGERGTLLLSRDRRVVANAPPEEILHALIGVRLEPDNLRAMLAAAYGRARRLSPRGRLSQTGSPSSSRPEERCIYVAREGPGVPWRDVMRAWRLTTPHLPEGGRRALCCAAKISISRSGWPRSR